MSCFAIVNPLHSSITKKKKRKKRRKIVTVIHNFKNYQQDFDNILNSAKLWIATLFSPLHVIQSSGALISKRVEDTLFDRNIKFYLYQKVGLIRFMHRHRENKSCKILLMKCCLIPWSVRTQMSNVKRVEISDAAESCHWCPSTTLTPFALRGNSQCLLDLNFTLRRINAKRPWTVSRDYQRIAVFVHPEAQCH